MFITLIKNFFVDCVSKLIYYYIVIHIVILSDNSVLTNVFLYIHISTPLLLLILFNNYIYIVFTQ